MSTPLRQRHVVSTNHEDREETNGRQTTTRQTDVRDHRNRTACPLGVIGLIALLAAIVIWVCLVSTDCQHVLDGPRPADGLDVPGHGGRGQQLDRNRQVAEYIGGVNSTDFPPTFSNDPTHPSPRSISNIIMNQISELFTDSRLTALMIYFGQFVDHDLDLSELSSIGEEAEDCESRGGTVFQPGEFKIPVPKNDPVFNSSQPLDFTRTGICIIDGKPTHPNVITSFLDASNVYGSNSLTTKALRSGSGGRLRTYRNNPQLLPLLSDIPEDQRQYVPLAMADRCNENPASCFVAGDRRVNEHVTLTAFHTLFMMEHNTQADRTQAQHPDWTDEQTFEAARRIVIAEMQAIVFNEFVPALLGDECPSLHQRETTTKCACCVEGSAAITEEFSTFGYRFGHDGIPNTINVELPNSSSVLQLQDVFFVSVRMLQQQPNLVQGLMKGLSTQKAMAIDAMVVDGLRNALFKNQGFQLDLASLNIRRGQDHGIRPYPDIRRAYKLPAKTLDTISTDPSTNDKFKQAYTDITRVDAFVGMLGEDPHGSSRIGELGTNIICNQFTRVKNADPFYFECYEDLKQYSRTRLSDILNRNLPEGNFNGHVMTQQPFP